MQSDTDRMSVLTAARTELGNGDSAIHSMDRILSKPGGGEDKSLTPLADTTGYPPSSDTVSIWELPT